MVVIVQIQVRVHVNDAVVDNDKYVDNHLEIDVRKTSLKKVSWLKILLFDFKKILVVSEDAMEVYFCTENNVFFTK
jgi:hypothetical protein